MLPALFSKESLPYIQFVYDICKKMPSDSDLPLHTAKTHSKKFSKGATQLS
jgi:hypothetical protein